MPIYKMNGSKGGKQKYRVRVNYQDMNGINRQTDRVVYGRSEAVEFEREFAQTIKNESPSCRMTVKDLYKEYYAKKQAELREQSLRGIKTYIENHVIPSLGNVKLSKLNKPLLQKWKAEINEKTVKDRGKKKLSLRTKQHIYREFKALLNYAVAMDYLSKNPLTAIGNFKETMTFDSERGIDFYTPEEFRAYIKAARENAENSSYLEAWDFYVFFNIAFYTGLRKGEIHALKWSDIDGNYLSVSRSIAQKLKGADRETPPKNKSSIRTIQMPKQLIVVLNEHKKRYSAIKDFNDEFRICGGTKPLRDSTLDNKNKMFAKAAGIKHIRIHDFRHSHASLLANEGINIQEIARRLGHSKIEITWNTYSHLYPREEERAVKVLENII